MQNDITLEVFESLLGEDIEFKAGAVCFQARVDSVSLLKQNPSQERQPFSVELLADTTENHGQQIYELSHPLLGQVSLFAVPLGPGEEGMRYQIVFN